MAGARHFFSNYFAYIKTAPQRQEKRQRYQPFAPAALNLHRSPLNIVPENNGQELFPEASQQDERLGALLERANEQRSL